LAVPVRRCLACRRVAAKPSLVRFVVDGDRITVDALARQPGRGAYLCGQPGCTDMALRRDGAALRRALRADGRVEVRSDVLRGACAAALDERLTIHRSER